MTTICPDCDWSGISRVTPPQGSCACYFASRVNRMRRLGTVVSIQVILAFSIIPRADGSDLPNDARHLLEKRDEAVRLIDRRLVEELEKLKVVYTKRGDLDNANAIVALIDKFKMDPSGQRSEAAQIARLVGVWKRDYDGNLFEFDAKGGGVYGGREKFRVTYDPNEGHFELKRPQWGKNTIRFGADEDTLISIVSEKRPYKLTRIR